MSLKSFVRSLIPKRIYLLMHALSHGYDFAAGPFTYNEDGFATKDQAADFLNDPLFVDSYDLGKRTGSWLRSSEIRWRAYVCCWAARHAMGLDGDFVECGVNRGGYARAIINYTGFAKSGKKFYLLDTFEGIPAEQVTEEEYKSGRRPGVYESCYDEVRTTFSPFPFVKIVKGLVPATLDQVPATKVSYLSIDMNIREPEIAAAEFFWDKLVPGGVMLLDDYNFAFHPVQRRAFDEFAEQKGTAVLALPTGQGIILKR